VLLRGHGGRDMAFSAPGDGGDRDRAVIITTSGGLVWGCTMCSHRVEQTFPALLQPDTPRCAHMKSAFDAAPGLGFITPDDETAFNVGVGEAAKKELLYIGFRVVSCDNPSLEQREAMKRRASYGMMSLCREGDVDAQVPNMFISPFF
jgi:hypothetical protein